MINKVTLLGNVGKSPEVRRLDNGTPVASFSVATSESYKDDKGEWQKLTEWHRIQAWRGLAEYVEKNVTSGAVIYIEGKVSTRKYKDKDGIEKQITEIVANTIRCGFGKKATTNDDGDVKSDTDDWTNNVDAKSEVKIPLNGMYVNNNGNTLTMKDCKDGKVYFFSLKTSKDEVYTVEDFTKNVINNKAWKFQLNEGETLSNAGESEDDGLPF